MIHTHIDRLYVCVCPDVVLPVLQKSLINPTSEEGEKPDKFDGTVEFKDVCFAYPTRPDVVVSADKGALLGINDVVRVIDV